MHIYYFITLLDLNDFMQRLDARYAKKVLTEGGTVARKVRKSGEASKSLPPSDAPDWTVDPSYQRNREIELNVCIVLSKPCRLSFMGRVKESCYYTVYTCA